MENRDDYKYLKIKDALASINQRVSLIGAIVEVGLPKKTRGTDWCCSLKVVDQTYPKSGMTVNIFVSSVEQLPRVASLGDILQLSHVVIKKHDGQVNAVFNKRFSYFALYEGACGRDFLPYQYSSRYHPDQDSKFIAGLRNWLTGFHSDEGTTNYSFLREMKQGDRTDLACKVLHACEINKDEWMAFVWDGTDCPPVKIDSKLESESKNPLPLQLEPRPLPRDLLCTFPTVGTILRVIIEKGCEKHVLPLLITGKWVKFLNIFCEVRGGLWCGLLTPFSKLSYVSNDVITANEKSYSARTTSEMGRIPYWCFPWCSQVTEVDYEKAPFVTLMDVLTHSKVVSKFRSVVRVVAAFPWQPADFCSPLGTYMIRLTIEDPTARIHAFLYAEDAEEFFDGYPSVEVLTRKRNTLLGVTVNHDGKEIEDAPRNPPWVQCCLKSYYLDRNDTWGSRQYRIFGTKLVG